jgi:predicted dehydrogenase
MKTDARPRLNRRQFLQRAATAVAAPLVLPGSVFGLNGATAPSNRLAFGCIGVGSRVKHMLPNWLSFPDLKFIAVADCRADRLEQAKQIMDTHYGDKDCRTYADFRELLARKDIDAVLIGTGDRWHATMSIYAARAGKDIYSEKPVTLTIREGRLLVDACRQHGTIYQAGTQRRSAASYRFAHDMVQQGKIGKLHTVEIQVWADRGVPHDKAVPVPAGWNYDMWLGPVQWRPFVPGRMNGGSWNYFWDTGAGAITGMGTHYADQMQWTLNRDHTGPVEYETSDVVWPDPAKFMSETPITSVARCRYRDGIVGVMYQRKGFAERYIRYIGDEGWIQVDDQTDQVTAEPKSIMDLFKTGGAGWINVGGHVQDLLNSIRSRRPTICHPEAAHRAQTICEAMSLSMLLGRKLRWDPMAERFDCEDANRMMWREPRAPWVI